MIECDEEVNKKMKSSVMRDTKKIHKSANNSASQDKAEDKGTVSFYKKVVTIRRIQERTISETDLENDIQDDSFNSKESSQENSMIELQE